MVAHAVTRAWQKSLADAAADGALEQPMQARKPSSTAPHGWHRRDSIEAEDQAPVALGAMKAGDGDAPALVEKRDQIIPRRVAVSSVQQAEDGLLASRDFWMGIVLGAGIVLVIKTVLAVQAPFGIDWY